MRYLLATVMCIAGFAVGFTATEWLETIEIRAFPFLRTSGLNLLMGVLTAYTLMRLTLDHYPMERRNRRRRR